MLGQFTAGVFLYFKYSECDVGNLQCHLIAHYCGWCVYTSRKFFIIKVKVKQSRNRPGVARRVP